MVDYSVRIPTFLYRNSAYPPIEVVVYAFVQMVVVPNNFDEWIYFTPNSILYYMYGGKHTRRESEMVVGAIKSLVDKNVLHINNEEICARDLVLGENERYALVPVGALQKVLRSSVKNKIDVAYYLVWLLGSRNSATKIGNQKIESFAGWVDVSCRTIERYNAVLEELQIIYFERDTKITIEDGHIYHDHNKYVLWEHKDLLEESNVEKSHNKKRLAAQLNYINAHPDKIDKYPVETLWDIYEYAVAHNEYLEQNAQVVGTKKDVAVIEQALFF